MADITQAGGAGNYQGPDPAVPGAAFNDQSAPLQPKDPQAQTNLILSRSRSYQTTPEAQNFWKAFPMQWGNLITSNLPEQHHQALAVYAPQVHQFIASQNAFGGVDGALTQLYIKALAIPDPAIRAQNLMVINDIKTLPVADQSAFMAAFNNPQTMAQYGLETSVTHGADAGLTGTGSPIQAGLDQLFGANSPDMATYHVDRSGKVIVDESVSAGFIAAIYNQFPSLRGKLEFSGGMTASDVTESFLNSPMGSAISPMVGKHVFWQGHYIQLGPDGKPLKDANGNYVPMDAAGPNVNWSGEKIAASTLSGFGAGIQGVSEGVHFAGQQAAGSNVPVLNTVGTAVNDAATVIIDPALKIMGAAFKPVVGALGSVADAGYHAATGRHMSQEAKDVTGNLILIAGSSVASEGLGTFKTTLSTEAEAAAGQFGIQDGVFSTINASFDQAAADSRFGKLGAAVQHPFDILVNPAVRYAAYRAAQAVRDTSLANWVEGSQWAKIFNKIDVINANADDPAIAAAQIGMRYPLMTQELADQLSIAARDEMPSTVVNYHYQATGEFSMGTNARLNSNLAKQAAAQNELSGLADPVAAAQAAFDEVTKHRVPGNVVDQGINPVPEGVIDPRLGENPTQYFHGGKATYDVPSDQVLDPDALRGPAHYATNAPEVAGGGIDPLTGEIRRGYAQNKEAPTATQVYDSLGGAKDQLTKDGYEPVDSLSQDTIWQNSDGETANIIPKGDGTFAVEKQLPGSPQVRPVYHNNPNPFNFDEPVTPEDVRRIMESVQKLDPQITDIHVGNVESMIGDKPGHWLYEELRHMNISKTNINLALEDAGYSGMIETGGNIVGGFGNHEVSMVFHADQVSLGVGGGAPTTAEVLAAHENLTQAVGDSATKAIDINANLTDLKAREAELRAQLVEDAWVPGRPVQALPGGNSLPQFLHRTLYADMTASETLVRKLFYDNHNPLRASSIDDYLASDSSWTLPPKEPWLAKLNDKLSAGAEIRFADPQRYNAVELEAIKNSNLQFMQRLLKRFAVPNAEASTILADISEAKTQAEFYDVVSKDVFGDTGILNRYLPKDVTPAARENLISFSGRSTLDYSHGVVIPDANGIPQMHPIMRDGAGREIPTAPNDFALGIKLPSADAQEAVLSSAKRWGAKMEAAKGVPGAAGMIYDLGQNALRLSTVAMKVPALLFDLPAIILTKILDEAVGNSFIPNVRNNLVAGQDPAFRITAQELGNVYGGIFQMGDDAQRIVQNVSSTDVLNHVNGSNAVYNTLASDLIDMHGDPLLSAIARTDMSMPEIQALIGQGGDFQAFYEQQMVPQLMKGLPDGTDAGAYLASRTNEWLTNLHDSISQSTFGHPDFQKLVADGNLGGQGANIYHQGEPVGVQYARLNEQADQIRYTLESLNPLHPQDISDIRANQALLKTKLEAINHLEELAAQSEDATTVLSKPTIAASNPQLLADEIKRRVEGNEITLPDIMQVDRMATRGNSNMGGAETLGNLANRIGNYFYNFDKEVQLQILSEGRLGDTIGDTRLGRWLTSEHEGHIGFQTISNAEAKTARGAFYYSKAQSFFEGYLRQGMSADDALGFARADAADLTKDYFYDLSARSTLERQVRNVFWFAPVNGELLYRWLYAIPAESGGLIPGAAILLAKASAYNNLFKALGVFHTDPVTGREVMGIPGLSTLLNQIPGVKVPGNLAIPVATLSAHLSSPIPTTSPFFSVMLNQIGKYSPIVKDLAKIVAPYADVTVNPFAIRNIAAMGGIRLPDVSNDYVNQQYSRTYDVAIQYATADLNKKGIFPPSMTDYAKNPVLPTDAERGKYLAAWTSYIDQVKSGANEYNRGLSLLNLMSGSLFPGSITASSTEQTAFQKYFQKNVIPDIVKTGTIEPAVRDALNVWLSAHPDSMAYSVSYNYYTGKPLQSSVATTDPSYWREIYAQGVKAHMDPAQYLQFNAAMESYQLMIGRQNAAIRTIAPTGQWTDVVTNWYQRSQAVTATQTQWQTFLDTHPDVKTIIDAHSFNAKNFLHIPTESIQTQYIVQAMTSLKALAPLFQGTDGLTNPEYASALSKIKQLYAQGYQGTGGAVTPMQKGINDYLGTVVIPYMDATKGLYDQAAVATSAGQDASAIYQQIDAIRAKYSTVKVDGKVVPIDKFFYGAQSPLQRTYTVTHWQTEPLSWLTPFQRETAGYTNFTGEDQMWSQVQNIRTLVANSIDAQQLTSSSTAYQALIKWRDNQLVNIGNQYGTAGAAAISMETASPYVRLQTQGYGAGNSSMQTLYSMVQTAQDTLSTSGSSPGGYSGQALQLKSWVYGYIYQQEQNDPQFASLMQGLSFSQKPDASTGLHPTGVPLYESIFFGNFNKAFIPPSFIANVQTGAA